MTNTLYFGDNLHVLREYVKDETVDLIYLDPPFNSNANYNVLFRAPSGARPKAQVDAFQDTWHWGEEAEQAFDDVKNSRTGAAGIIRALRSFLGENDLMAYLAMMAVRLIEMRRVLRPTGSIYLHCDPVASHYLKILLDGIFGSEGFLNEIIWKRTSAHSSAKRYGPVHDTILFYSRSNDYNWNKLYQPYDQTYIDAFYTHVDPDGRRWRRSDVTGAGVRHGETGLPWRGINVTAKGRHWAWPPAELDRMDEAGKIHWPEKAGGMPMFKRYLSEQPGVPVQDVITDIVTMHNLSQERTGYQTQKPLSLLERLISASSNPEQVVLDPFCGCGTAVHAASKLGRQWIGIDITHVAIQVIEDRLARFCPGIRYEVQGRPEDLEDAQILAARDKYQFQWWATSLVKAQPRGGYNKKGGDRGIDGEIYFKLTAREDGRAIVSVKGGANVGPSMVRDLIGTRESEDAEMALLITLTEPTQEMITAAAKDGFVGEGDGRVLRTQILTIKQMFAGMAFRTPGGPIYDTTAAAAAAARTGPRVRRQSPEELRREPPLPPMPIEGGRSTPTQKDLPLDEPLLQPVQQRRRKSLR